MIPTTSNHEAVAARLFVGIAAIERIAHDLWWHASLPVAQAPDAHRKYVIAFDSFPAFAELAEACADCERLLRRLDNSLVGTKLRCAGELVTRAEAAVLLAHLTALREETQDSAWTEPALRERVRNVHARVCAGLAEIAAKWASLPAARDAAGPPRAWTFEQWHAYLETLQAARRSLLELKRDPSLRGLVLAGIEHSNSWIGTTCQLLLLVLDFQIDPHVWGRITPYSLKGKP